MSASRPLIALGCLMLLAAQATADPFILDNKDNNTVITAGSQSSILFQSFRINYPGAGTPANGGNDNIASLPPGVPVALNTATFVRAPASTTLGTAGPLFLDLYEFTGPVPHLGAYIGSSTNSIDVNNAAPLSNLTWNFPSLWLTQGVEYLLQFSTDGVAGNPATGRIAGANFGSGFGNTYTGGSAAQPNGTLLGFDTRFELTASVPEPASIMVLLGGVAISGWRLRQKKSAAV